jgi:hypothetical protein
MAETSAQLQAVQTAVSAQPAARTIWEVRAERRFLVLLYVGALVLRVMLAAIIYHSGYREFFAGDSWTYDYFGWGLARFWAGELQHPRWLLNRLSVAGQNGMYYWVAAIYSVIGRSEFGAALIQCFVVSFTPILAYKISDTVYHSKRAARLAAFGTAFLPSMVIWSCTLLKDPLIVFLVCVTVYCTLKAQRELKLQYAIPGAIAMLLIFPVRGYVFYFILVAVVGTLLLARFGTGSSLGTYLMRVGLMIGLCILLFAVGFNRIASQQLNANLLEQVQRSRADLAQSARSGFALNANVSTLQGAVEFLPKGVAYLLFAPFPWQSGGLRLKLAIPETVVWYAFFPFCLIGMVVTARRHLRDALIIFLFVLQLTCFYAVFLGNVGTAHRQRTQVFVFYIIFTSAGLVYSRRRFRRPDGTIAD